MDLILCHQTVDFDALGAAVGLTRLKPGGRVVLTGGAHPTVKEFLALHRDELFLIERRSVHPETIRTLAIVDTQKRDRLGKAAEWIDLPHLSALEVYDHHLEVNSDIPATYTLIEPVGATTTLIVEQLQQQQIVPTPLEATVMALGIHVDTGSLTFEQTTSRDAKALAWLLEQGASLRDIAEYVEPGLSPRLQELLAVALEDRQEKEVHGYKITWILLQLNAFLPGLSSLAEQLVDLTETDALFLAASYSPEEKGSRMSIIGRSHIQETHLNRLFRPLGGGGHAQAASANLRDVTNSQDILNKLIEEFSAQIPSPPTARDLMSSPVRTIRPQTTISEAQRILLRYGHSGLSVVNENDELVGVISRRDLDLALHHGFSHAPVKGYMSRQLKTVTPETPLKVIEDLMVTYDVGRLPVLEKNALVGIVTRTDVLRQRHADDWELDEESSPPKGKISQCLITNPQSLISPATWELLNEISQEATQRGWHLYLVGGAVRDLLLAEGDKTIQLKDIDLVVDGFYRSADVGAGVELAKALQEKYTKARLDVHGAFQTAALLWHNDPQLDSLWVDIATARTEFYPYPAANPEVEASSIRQDLYRRDFSINALALRLTPPRKGELLDFFGGVLDLQSRQIRVLHANSFIEDPTRIYRAVRFAVRLGFEIESQTESYIRYAIESGIYERSWALNRKTPALQTRLKAELKYILQAGYWKSALELLASLGALHCLHSQLELNSKLWWQVRLVDRCLQRFDPSQHLTHWQIRLEVLIASVPPSERRQVAEKLQMPVDAIERLGSLEEARIRVIEELSATPSPSQVVRLLNPYKLPTLVLLCAQTPRKVRGMIWQYLTQWSQIHPPLNGNDLKALGYKPGPQYKEILDDLLTARLDGILRGDRQSAEAFLRKHYH